jgi:hypothetical protein
MGKFTVLNQSKEWIPYDYGNIFFREPMASGERLVVGPGSKHADVMLALARTWRIQQFYILYVLLISHSGAHTGRYQSPLIESFEDLEAFFHTYKGFLESDGRHHIWIGSPANDGTLVYDQHNVIFAYGDLSKYDQVLTSRGFSPEEFCFPCPHSHSYPTQNVQQEEELLSHFPWRHSPLQDGDEWD